LTNVIIHSLRSLSRIYALMLFPSSSALAFVSVFCCSPLPLCCHLLHSPFCGGFAPDLVHLVRSMSTKLRKFRNAFGTVSRSSASLRFLDSLNVCTGLGITQNCNVDRLPFRHALYPASLLIVPERVRSRLLAEKNLSVFCRYAPPDVRHCRPLCSLNKRKFPVLIGGYYDPPYG
jgi:hypothetical protein